MNKNPNPSPKTRFKPQWNKGKTRTIRLPIILAENTLNYARKLDNNEIPDNLVTRYSDLVNELKDIIEKINKKEKGYKANNASQLVRDIRKISDKLTTN